MPIPQLTSFATEFVTIASDVVAAKTIESHSGSFGPEWLLIGLGSILVLSAKAVLFVKATKALSTNAQK